MAASDIELPLMPSMTTSGPMTMESADLGVLPQEARIRIAAAAPAPRVGNLRLDLVDRSLLAIRMCWLLLSCRLTALFIYRKPGATAYRQSFLRCPRLVMARLQTDCPVIGVRAVAGVSRASERPSKQGWRGKAGGLAGFEVWIT